MWRWAVVVILAVVATCGCGPATSRTSGSPTPRAPAADGARAGPATVPAGPVALAGCPPSPTSHPPVGAPWHPDHLVPDASLPAPVAPVAGTPSLTSLSGKGMWIWQWHVTEGGQAAAVLARARAAGLHQLWVRVADSQDRFYAADELASLVPLAHAAGIAVIAWGFPFLYDPVDDAAWTADVLAWRGSHGESVDGYSADIEMPSEGVALSGVRVSVYLGLVRRAAAGRPVVGTVYPPTDRWWPDAYPYAAIARYVDAFAPMEYWECRQPGDAAAQALARLSPLRPVHLVGQAFSFAGTGGRIPAPSPTEMGRFLDTGRIGGAVGASFWVWQLMDASEWSALSAYRWAPAAD
ncbi:MAG TPA: hypothetical protein VFO60_03235 [Candidatus Dormibacteraeota bacterium]|nr:hypothetical protein [Candidatus Dormibacteraeota bacterium]